MGGRDKAWMEQRYARLGERLLELTINGNGYDFSIPFSRSSTSVSRTSEPIDAHMMGEDRYAIGYFESEERGSVTYEFDGHFRRVEQTFVHLQEWVGANAYRTFDWGTWCPWTLDEGPGRSPRNGGDISCVTRRYRPMTEFSSSECRPVGAQAFRLVEAFRDSLATPASGPRMVKYLRTVAQPGRNPPECHVEVLGRGAREGGPISWVDGCRAPKASTPPNWLLPGVCEE